MRKRQFMRTWLHAICSIAQQSSVRRDAFVYVFVPVVGILGVIALVTVLIATHKAAHEKTNAWAQASIMTGVAHVAGNFINNGTKNGA